MVISSVHSKLVEGYMKGRLCFDKLSTNGSKAGIHVKTIMTPLITDVKRRIAGTAEEMDAKEDYWGIHQVNELSWRILRVYSLRIAELLLWDIANNSS